MSDDKEHLDYVKDKRIACKFGVKCFQKNPLHHKKYKHPPKPTAQKRTATCNSPPPKRFKVEDEEKQQVALNDIASSITKEDADATLKEGTSASTDNAIENNPPNNANIENEKIKTDKTIENYTPAVLNEKQFIKSKFLVTMPDDFYQFWNMCQTIKPNSPSEAFKDVNLFLVGPFDVLANKFSNIPEMDDEKYLIHWRYFYDPPEFQTVIKGDDKAGFHIGYFRDSPEDLPVFLATNCALKDGIFHSTGQNIFAAVYLYLQDFKKTGDPFKKMQIAKLEKLIKNEASKLNLSLVKKTPEITKRNNKIVTKTFNKLGLVVDLNKRTQVGYRELAMSDVELKKILDKIAIVNDDDVERQALLSKLQPVISYASIAIDECDFGTGLELGLNILAHGVKTLNNTILRFLLGSYKLLKKETFAKIAEAHLKNRKEDVNLSII